MGNQRTKKVLTFIKNVKESNGVRVREVLLSSCSGKLPANVLAHIIERGIRELALAHGVKLAMIRRCRVEFGYGQDNPDKITISIER